MKMRYAQYVLTVVCLVLAWAGQKSVNGDPVAAAAPMIGGHRPIWYNSPFSTSLVYQKSANSASMGESRAFPSPVYYAPAVLPAKATTTTTEATPKSAKKFDVLKFFDKLKHVNEKYAKRNPTVGTKKQLNEDAEEEDPHTATTSDDDGDHVESSDRAESDDNEMASAEAINEGMLIVTKMCDSNRFDNCCWWTCFFALHVPHFLYLFSICVSF